MDGTKILPDGGRRSGLPLPAPTTVDATLQVITTTAATVLRPPRTPRTVGSRSAATDRRDAQPVLAAN